MSETPGQVLWRVFGYDERPLEECPRPTQDLYNGVAAAFLAEMSSFTADCPHGKKRWALLAEACEECDRRSEKVAAAMDAGVYL